MMWDCILCTEFTFISRFTHIEAECPFITFDDLLDKLEDLIVDVVERVLASPVGHLVYEFNPNFKAPKRPFRRMNYSAAIEYLREHNITKEDGSYYEFGEDIPEMPERKMTDEINERKFGSCPHGGYGLGLERFITWLLNRYHIRDACLYPRFVDRCVP
ncbi:asparagine--tRNA ligase, cytoplasmic-like [Centruroides vittatus]|uniref:asparagine--tRNA ligase, cytoplasmic-like n=1 Tax=Centruroides vittatus TaxID=120091 RepID=UPI00350F31B6